LRRTDLALVDWPAVIDALSESVIAADPDGRIVYVNAAAELLLGWTADELGGAELVSVIPERFRDRHVEAFAKFAASGEGQLLGRPLRVPARRKDGTEIPIEMVISRTVVSDRHFVVGLLRDVSERVEVEGPGDLSDRLVASLAESAKLEEAWPRVLQAAVEELGWDLGQLWLRDDRQGDYLRRVCAWAASESEFGAFVAASGRVFERGEGLPGRVWHQSAPVWVTDVELDMSFPRADAAAAAGLRSGFAFPLSAGGRLLGVVELFSAQSRPPNPAITVRLVELGRELGWYIERRTGEEQRLGLLNSERAARAEAERAQQRLEETLARTAEIASTLQRSLLPPQLPDVRGVAMAARYLPAGEGNEVGGDFYDVFRLTAGTWGVVIGDVCGKGAEAAAVTAFARYTIRAAAMQERSPAKALAALNRAMLNNAADGGPDLFATMVLARLRTQPGSLSITLACGGHPLPMIRRASGAVHSVGRPGTLLGVFDTFGARDSTVSLGIGDSLVLVTDGVLEARRQRQEWGQDRLASLLESLDDASPDEIAAEVTDAVLDYRRGQTADDIAILVIQPSGA
jgi:PAS domain S-box-containing protein